VTGNVCPVTRNLKSPLKGESCVYYQVEAQQLMRDKNRQVEEWRPAFTDVESMDFILADPAASPEQSVIVHGKGSKTNLRYYAVMNGSLSHEERFKQRWTFSSSANEAMKALAAKGNFDLIESKGFFGEKQKTMRYFEYTLGVNGQVAILGIVKEKRDAAGNTMRIIEPVRLCEQFIYYTVMFESWYT
jgi:hypothetical protein